jgi:hypothetical protein
MITATTTKAIDGITEIEGNVLFDFGLDRLCFFHKPPLVPTA